MYICQCSNIFIIKFTIQTPHFLEFRCKQMLNKVRLIRDVIAFLTIPI